MKKIFISVARDGSYTVSVIPGQVGRSVPKDKVIGVLVGLGADSEQVKDAIRALKEHGDSYEIELGP